MYKKRLVDRELEEKLDIFGGVLITGPKGCGKTTTAKQKAKSIIEFQDEDKRENYLMIANIKPSELLKGRKPRLFDEWQDAPKIWGAIRKDIDDSGLVGQYILTGSSSQKVTTPHTGTMRISRLKMGPMSLYESEDSNGEISLEELINNPPKDISCHSEISIDELKYLICRGGWPRTLSLKTQKAKFGLAKDLVQQTCEVDINNIDGVSRNAIWAKTILKSYSRNICTLAETKTIFADVANSCGISKQSFYDYIKALEQLYIIDDIDAWCPSIRSKTAIRATKKRNLVDPSIAAASLGISTEYLSLDYKTFGFLFESLCLRDLKIYAQALGGDVSYYRDRYGLEADAVVHLDNGNYAVVEIKLGPTEIDSGAKHLCEIEKLVEEKNKLETEVPLKKPNAKIIITGTEYGYKRDDGVFVVPIGCLKD